MSYNCTATRETRWPRVKKRQVCSVTVGGFEKKFINMLLRIELTPKTLGLSI